MSFRSLYEPGVALARLAELTWAGRKREWHVVLDPNTQLHPGLPYY